jgi:mRNA interferase MazF
MAARVFAPSRSDVWLADFDHIELDADGRIVQDQQGRAVYTRHREHGGKRPCVVLSNDEFNQGWAELVIVVPITKEDKGISTHVPITPPEGGLRLPSFVICEGIRSIARQFLIQKWGRVEDTTLQEIELELRKLMRFAT